MSNTLVAPLIMGFESCRLKAYQDRGGVWTCGWGSTGPDITSTTIWTQQQADDRFAATLSKTLIGVRASVRIPISEKQEAALCSFAYNVGPEAERTSTLLQYVNSGAWFSVVREWIKWDHVGKDEDRGLLIRRLKEAAIFLEGSA